MMCTLFFRVRLLYLLMKRLELMRQADEKLHVKFVKKKILQATSAGVLDIEFELWSYFKCWEK